MDLALDDRNRALIDVCCIILLGICVNECFSSSDGKVSGETVT